MREGKAYRNHGANVSTFREQRHRGKKTFTMKMLDLISLSFAHVCYLNVENGESTTEYSAEGWVGKVTGEGVIALPLPGKADVELTPGSYQLKESVYGLAWSSMGWARSCTGGDNSVPVLHTTRLGLFLFCELENCVIQT